MSDTTQHTIGEKIEIIQATKEHGWNVAEASQATGIPRSTLLGYLAAEDELFSTEGDPTSKRMSRPGIPLPHQASESVVVTLVKEKAFRGEKMSRSSIGAECAKVIPGVSEKGEGALNSWVTRFIKRNDLSDHVALHQKKAKCPRSPRSHSSISTPAKQQKVSSQPEKTQASASSKPENTQAMVSSKPEKTQTRVSSKPEKTQAKVSSSKPLMDENIGCKDFPLEIDEGDETTETPPVENVSDNTLVCSTSAVSFQPETDNLRLEVTKKNLKTLQPDCWLDDTVISYFIREHIPSNRSTFNFDCQLFGLLLSTYKRKQGSMEAVYEATCGVTARFPYEKYRIILVPVCMNAHWSFVVMQNPVLAIPDVKPYILHVDSKKYHSTQEIKDILGGYFKKEAAKKYGKRSVAYATKRVQTSPPQHNSNDCGVFMLYFMREVNRALLHDPNLLLLLNIGNTCSVSKKIKFNCDIVRMQFLKLFYNDQALQS
jgi:hypothetical protein